MKKALSLLAISVLLLLAACGSSEEAPSTGNANPESPEETEAISLRLGHVGPEGSAVDQGAKFFAEKVNEKTDGKITIEIFPNGVLGGDRDMTESVSNGTLSLTMPNLGILSNFTPAFTGIQIPFLVENAEMLDQLYKSDLYRVDAPAELEAMNVKGLSFVPQGFAEIGSPVKAFHTLEDAKGITIRATENNIMIDSLSELGMAATSIPYPDMYSSLETGVIDAGTLPLESWISTQMAEIINYVTLADFLANPHYLIMNLTEFNGLPQEFQDAIVEAAYEMEDHLVNLDRENNDLYIQQLKDMGLEVVEMENREEFVERMQPVYEKFGQQEPWIQRALDLIEELKQQ